MSVLHSIVPLEHIYINEQEINPRIEMVYQNMLIEVEYHNDNIVLNRIINGPLDNYLNQHYTPGSVIGKRHSIY